MIIWLYSAALTAGLLLSAPWWIMRMLSTNRYREGLAERLGRVPRRLRGAIQSRQVVWVHAVSVGEVLAASRLVKELEQALNRTPGEAWCVVVSTTTRTGQGLARERFHPERVFYFPLDFGWSVKAYLRALQPRLLVLMESELWPRMLHECDRAGVPTAVVNARVSDRSFRRASRWPRGTQLWARLLDKVTLWLAQSEGDAARLSALGASESALKITGNLKYDIRAPRESRVAELIREVAGDRPIIVAGSTVDRLKEMALDENEMLIRAWEGDVRRVHGALLVLAPRHPEFFDAVHSVASEFPTVRGTELLAALRPNATTATSSCTEPREEVAILLLDTIGDLAAVYALADMAFVGGSLVRRGGHNPLEPAQFGVPVLMGPSFENFREIVAKLQAAGALCVIEGVDELESAMLSLLNDRVRARAMGERGRRVFEQEGGATARTIEALLPLITRGARKGGKVSGHEATAAGERAREDRR